MNRRSSAYAASQTQLPPSPEFKSLPAPSQGTAAFDELSLLGPSALSGPPSVSGEATQIAPTTSSRLLAIAKYESFRPTALACSAPLLLSSSSHETTNASFSENQDSSSFSCTSLGALSGSKGVSLFRVSAPQKPLLVLSCHSPTTTRNNHNTTTNNVRSMVFQPPPSRHNNDHQYHGNSSTLALAAVRGNGILVWDVGHSLNPLTARMGGNSTSINARNNRDDVVLSLSWYMGDSAGNLLASATSSYACLWDLRESSSSSVGSSRFPSLAKPSVRFGGAMSRNSAGEGIDYIQLACSNASDCALLGTNGVVQVFDIRMVQQHKNSPSSTTTATSGVGGAHDEFRAHDAAGIGISHLPQSPASTSSSPRWVTWGLDTAFNETEVPAVRIWERSEKHSAPPNSSAIGGKADAGLSPDSQEPRLNLTAQCQVPNLACARVFGHEYVVTVSQDTDSNMSCKWDVDLWKLSSKKGEVLTRNLSFHAGQEANQKVSTMLGNNTNVGRLLACELAVSTVSPRIFETSPPSASEEEEEEEEGYSFVQKEEDLSVMVLGLTETGFLTSHRLPEAVPETLNKAKSMRISQSTNLSYALRSNLSPHHKVRVFPESRESVFGDIAGAWNAHDERVNLRETSSGQMFQQTASAAGHVGEGQMQFDLDTEDERLHYPSGIRNKQDTIELNRSSQSGDSSLSSRANATHVMEKIETQNIPCPRLCGATFSPGVGGLVTFNNGEVKRMWKWFRGDVSVPRRQLSRSGISSIAEREQSATSDGTAIVVQDTVRTVKDLFDMMKASKESQWGAEQDNADASSSNDSDRLAFNFFEDDDSGEDDDDDDDDDSSDFVVSANDLIMEKVSGQKTDDRTDPKSNLQDSSKTLSDSIKASGPSSDVLTPHVQLKQHINVASFNRQSPALALQLKLGNPGSWVYSTEIEPDGVSPHNPITNPFDDGLLPRISNNTTRQIEQRLDLAATRPSGPLPENIIEPESSVHAGAYGVRPGMQEPVDFLKKLFSHQQQAEPAGYSGLMLPPDKRLLPTTAKDPARFRRVTASDPFFPGRRKHKPGVYTRSRICTWSSKVQQRLVEARHLCAHNAKVCRLLGDLSKASIWDVLQQIVEGRLTAVQSKTGVWNTKAGDALASNFLSNTLRFLEYNGDIQMLATVVCVLRTDTQDLPKHERKRCVFLPVDTMGRYDSYIQMYSRILYAWRLLSVRAELNKRLSPEYRDDPFSLEFTALALPSLCNLCGEKNRNGSTLCSSCNSFLFRCVVCETACKGLFTYCLYCGHGGHASHLFDYFQLRQECPTGCGCRCVFAHKAAGPAGKRTTSRIT